MSIMQTSFSIEARDRFILYPITLPGSFEGRKQAADYIDVLVRALHNSGSTSYREMDGSVSIDRLISLRIVHDDHHHWTRDLENGLDSHIEADLSTLQKFITQSAERESEYVDNLIEQAIVEDFAYK